MKPRPVLTFDPETHKYYLDGSMIPGVTGVIRQQLSPLHNGQSDLMQRAALFGSAVHRATELWDQGRLDVATLDPALHPYLNSWMSYREAHPGRIVCNEGAVCSYRYRFAGTLDRMIELADGLALVDIKTSTVPDAGVGPQTAAYLLAAQEYLGIKCKARLCVQLTADGYKIHTLKNKTDQAAFLAALSCYNWRTTNGK